MIELIRGSLESGFGLRELRIDEKGTGQASTSRYVVTKGDQKWIAKHYGHYFSERLGWVEFECRLLHHLGNAGLAVAHNVETVDGEPFLIVDGTPLVLYRWAEGGTQWPASVENAFALGAALAEMHRSADDLPLVGNERVYGIEALIDHPLELIGEFTDAEAFGRLAELGDALRKIVSKVPTDSPCFGPIHGDIHQGNCHFVEGGQLTVFDFALAGVGYRTYDLTGFLWPMRDETIEDPAMRECCVAFLEGYESVRPLHPAEKDAIPAFVQIRSLWESGDWIEAGAGREQPDELRKIASYLIQQFENVSSN